MAVWSLDEEIPVKELATLESLVSQTLADECVNLALVGLVALLALVLSTLGIYDIVFLLRHRAVPGARNPDRPGRRGFDHRVARRRPRTDPRPSRCRARCLASLATTGIISGLLFGVRPTDPLTFAAISVLLIAAAAAASYLPARRASKVDPIAALRVD